MPIYEYRCQICQHEMEVMQKMADEALTTCPDCGKEGLTKLISRSSFQLKGTGWYQTDFKNGPTKPASETKPATSESTAAVPASTTATAAATTTTTSSSETT